MMCGQVLTRSGYESNGGVSNIRVRLTGEDFQDELSDCHLLENRPCSVELVHSYKNKLGTVLTLSFPSA
jgi:hypothetical protein